MANVLYISLTGIIEPLGESQVLQYLLELAKTNHICLFTFEKPVSSQQLAAMKSRLQAAGIDWRYTTYSNRFGMLSTLWQISFGFLQMLTWMKREKVTVIHARSLIPALMGRLLRKCHRAKLLFDIRGFAIDEKIMDGRLKEESILTNLLRKIEANTYRCADHIVTLTHVSKKILNQQYHVANEAITVIPTCVNNKLFKPLSAADKLEIRKQLGLSENDTLFMHNGSINGSIDFAGVVQLFSQLASLDKSYKFIFLNKNQHKLIKKYLQEFNLDLQRCLILSIPFDEIYQYVNVADLYVFFIKPSFAKQASSPTKFAEGVACHLYSVTNKNYGDMEYYLNHYPVGLLLDPQEVHKHTATAAEKVVAYLSQVKSRNNDDSEQFNKLLSDHFTRDLAIARYNQLYREAL